MKLWWRLRQNETPWARFMHNKYIRGEHPLVVQVTTGSAIWKRVSSVRELVEENTRWCLGEGFVDFWHDRWLLDVPLIQLNPTRPHHFSVAEFFTKEGWNLERFRKFLPLEIVASISKFIVRQSIKDEMVWLPLPDGKFTVSSDWSLIRKSRNLSVVSRGLWCSLLLLKMSFFGWRLLLGYLPLDDSLQTRGICVVSRCGCCREEIETLHHVFLHSKVVQETWHYFFGLTWRLFSCVSSLLLTWSQSSNRGDSDHIRCAILVIVLWFLWRSRNDNRYQNMAFTSFKVIQEVNHFLISLGPVRVCSRKQLDGDLNTYCVSFFHLTKPPSFRLKAVSWSKPPRGLLKLNTDVSVINGQATGGGILRDHDGAVFGAFYKDFGECDILHVKGFAPLFGLNWCLESKYDSQSLVRLVNSGVAGKWPLCNAMSQIRFLLSCLQGNLTHVYREANAVANGLASLALRSDVVFNTMQQLPTRIKSLANLDSIGCLYIRAFSVRE